MDKDTRDNISFYDVHVVSASGNENLNKQSLNKDKNYINKIKRKFLKIHRLHRPIILQNEKRTILRVCDWIHLGYNNLLSLDDDKYTATRKIW